MLDLSFSFDRDFKIIQLVDLGLANAGGEREQRTLTFLERLFAVEQPDLTVVGGGLAEPPLQPEIFQLFCDFMDKREVRWAYTFGERDRECAVPSRALESILLHSKCCLYERGDLRVDGEGNYRIALRDTRQRMRWLLYMLDSGTASGAPYMAHSVIAWCRRTRAEMTEKCRILYFFYRPLSEYARMYQPESVAEQSLNSGFLASVVSDARSAGIFTGSTGNVCHTTFETDGVPCALGARSTESALFRWRTILLPARTDRPVTTSVHDETELI